MLEQLSPSRRTNFFPFWIFSFKDIWLFIIGIIFVSATSGSIGAFMLGVGAEEFFLGESENILVVTQPGITTPFTGQVPLALQSDIQQILGVLAISPETLGLSVVQNHAEKSIIVRGITNNFTSLVSPRLIKGSWFDPRLGYSSSLVINGAMAGYILAENLGLSVGDTLLLASTLAETVVEIVVTGIPRTDSPSDEELLVSISLGETMTGKASGFVSYLRVLIDTKVISKEVVSDYLTQEFLVPISLTSVDPELTAILHEIPIIAYTPSGQHVKTQFIDSGNTTYFQLRFGTYEFIASPPNAGQSSVLRVFVNQFFYTPFEISIGTSSHDLTIKVLHNSHLAFNATVSLVERFNNQISFSKKTNESGIASFPDLPRREYHLAVYYQNLSYHSIYHETQSTLVTINIDSYFSLIVKNYTSGIEINGGNFRVLSLNGTIIFNTTDYISNTSIYIEPGDYRIIFEYTEYIHTFNLTIKGAVFRTIFLGSDNLDLWIRNSQKEGIPANISIQMPNKTVLNLLTDPNGSISVSLTVDLNYTINISLISNQTKIHTRSVIFRNQSSVVVDFLQNYSLNVHVRNGTEPDSNINGLDNSNVEIRNGNTFLISGFTNNTGHIQFSFVDPGNYSVSASNGIYTWEGYALVYNQTTFIEINLGKVRVAILTQSVSKSPVRDMEVSVSNSSGELFSLRTNGTGMAEFIVPVGNYTIKLNSVGFSSISTLNLSESQMFWLNIVVERSGNLSLTFENQFYQKLDLAFIILQNDYYRTEFKIFTDSSGKILLVDIPWGNYTFFVIVNEETYPKQTFSLVTNKLELNILIDTEGPILSSGKNIFWQDNSFSVVWSSEFVSGFLSSTLSLITTTLTTIVIIVSVLSLLSIASIISHPIVANGRTIKTFQWLGATRQQIVLSLVMQLTVLGFIASICGSLLGMWGMTVLPSFQHINIGGVIIRPRVDILLILTIIFSNLLVILVKATQKVNEMITSNLPSVKQEI